MKRHLSIAFALALALLVAGCAKKKRTTQVPAAPRAAAVVPHVGDEETGIASWYGYPYHGRRSSNGEIYDMEKLTAAHRTMAFGTIVQVRNLTNDRSVDVRITDRGPFIDGRVIDLSRAAAREIRMLGPGTAKVRLLVIGLPRDIPDGRFAVQVGAFKERANADRLRKELEERYGRARVVFRDGKPPVWRVLIGDEKTAEAAAALAGRIKNDTAHAFVVRVDAPESN